MATRTKAIASLAASLALALACGTSSPTHGTAADAAGPTNPDTGARPAHDAAKGPHDASGPLPLDATRETSSSDGAGPEGGGDGGILGARPYTLHVPTGYAKSTATPLVIMFHGYSASGSLEELYFDITATSDKDTFLYAYGNGTVDQTGNRFWNATNACCDLYNVPVDDVAYFDAILADVKSKYNVDPKRVFVIGHSNGGFMSHRLACDRASDVAAIVSLAGAVWEDPTKCMPSEHVSIAEVHGDADTTIIYTGGNTGEGTYPSATTTVATWAEKNGCTGSLTDTGTTLDLDTVLPGNETNVQGYSSCPAGVDVQLWTIHGGGHLPSLPQPGWGEDVWAFLSAHPKP